MPRTILIVDDDPDVLNALRGGLESQGYRILTAGDGLEGVQICCADRPDFIILDFHMPGGGGTTVYEALRELRGTLETPILFLTGVPVDTVKDNVRFRGRTDFLAKPASLEAILRIIKQALGG